MKCSQTIIALFGFSAGLLVLPVYAADMNDAVSLKPCGGEHGPILSRETVLLPPVDAEIEVEIGQTMVSTFNRTIMDGIATRKFSFDKGVQFSGKVLGDDFEVNVAPNKFVMYENAPPYNPPEYTFKYSNETSPRTGNWTKPSLLFSIHPKSGSVVAKLGIGFGSKVVVGTAEIEKTGPCTIFNVDSFRRELIYSGVSQGTVTLLYREFFGDMARPAFSQELRYDLKEGNEIGYKGARFKVIKANNTGIKYKIMKHLQ